MEKRTIRNRLYNRICNAIALLQNGHYVLFLTEFRKRLFSSTVSYGLRRDLFKAYADVRAKVPIHIRQFEPDDASVLFSEDACREVNPRIVASQRALIASGIPSCYVAVTPDGQPCYMQWLIGNAENDRIGDYFSGAFMPLGATEALLEGAYSNPLYRGLGIMPEAMSLIAQNALDVGVRWVLTYVDATNVASLKGCKRAGFEAYLLRYERWFLFRRSVVFKPMNLTMLNAFNNHVSKSGSKHPVQKTVLHAVATSPSNS